MRIPTAGLRGEPLPRSGADLDVLRHPRGLAHPRLDLAPAPPGAGGEQLAARASDEDGRIELEEPVPSAVPDEFVALLAAHLHLGRLVPVATLRSAAGLSTSPASRS